MTLEGVRNICRALPGVTEDVKWGHILVFSVWQKMFVVVDLDPPHSLAFKCTADTFVELIERPGLSPSPYLARVMWVQEAELGSVLGRRELEQLLVTAYELVRATLPKSKQPAAIGGSGTPRTAARRSET